MANEERPESEPIEAQVLDPSGDEDFGDDVILALDGSKPCNAQQYYIDLDDVLDEVKEDFPVTTATPSKNVLKFHSSGN
jgi:hypothetical protein